ncbi:MAG: hypothetical protein PF904_12200 [Kiritimatiellae bacterium]|jgi:hypothetical protein|nr:hypothetical protein [Kiritimatiellia bacterium]
MENRPYRAKPARRPVQYWLQPFVLILMILLLWHLLPITAVLFKPRVVQPLPAPHVFYVNLDPDYAMEILRASMQTWRSFKLGDSESDGMAMDDVELSMPINSPEFLEQGSIYPGKWIPGVVTPMAQLLPDLLCPTPPYKRKSLSESAKKQTGFHSELDAALRSAQLILPLDSFSAVKGSGRCRFYIETLQDGSVAHVLCLSSSVDDISALERALYLGRAKTSAQGEVEFWWRNP